MIHTTFEELRLTGRLPSPPGVGLRILKLTQREDCSAQEIGEAIMADAALTGTLLRIANSAMSGGVRPITTVTEATMRLGVRAVRNVGLGLSLVSAYRIGKCEHFDYDRYWSVSLARAVAAQRISEKLRYSVPAEAYVVGLLSDIGRLALATVYPTEYSTLLASCDTRDESALRVSERERFEIDHGEIGSYLLEEWGLPQVYSQAVMTYENPPQINVASNGELALVTNILRFAALVANVCTANAADPRTPWSRYIEQLEVMRITMRAEPGAFFEFLNGIAREWLDWGKVMHVPTPPPVDFAKLAEIAQRATAQDSSAVSVVDRPAQPEASETHPLATPPANVAPSDTRGLRILAVDDDPMSLKLLERHLVRAGHHVQCASDGNEALQIALDTNPQVVVADWMMPSLDGIELCKALRRIECGRDMFFLLLTGRGEEDRIVEAFDAGVDDYVVKPFIPKLLIARIKGGQRVIELKEKVEHDRQTMMKQVAELGLLTRKLRTAAMTDLLTELPNRRYAMRRLEQEWESSVRNDKSLSVIMIDIDHFKSVNDLHGHDVGDAVLKETANILRNTTRQGEDTARLGGEEFIVVCANTNLDQAMACAERIRAAVESHMISFGTFQRNVTISLGVAQRGPGITSLSALIKCADEAVYLAKNAGRNVVRAAILPSARSKSA
jgi:diguanylate cyclase (GGDEF)-like protein